MRTQLDGLTAGLVGRARCRRTTWRRIGRILGITEDTARHRYTGHYILRHLSELTRMSPPPAVTATTRTPSAPDTLRRLGGPWPLAPEPAHG
ncbi:MULTISPECIES: hypothetical protein [Streptomyces]|uniref:hypothetical protein n=1 Tax=Streptomyces TaxID=1883 RepID=UPI00345C1EA7